MLRPGAMPYINRIPCAAHSFIKDDISSNNGITIYRVSSISRPHRLLPVNRVPANRPCVYRHPSGRKDKYSNPSVPFYQLK